MHRLYPELETFATFLVIVTLKKVTKIITTTKILTAVLDTVPVKGAKKAKLCWGKKRGKNVYEIRPVAHLWKEGVKALMSRVDA